MSVIDLLQRYRVAFDASGRNKSRPGWVNLRCPLCQKWPYLGIRLVRPYANCWNCGMVPLTKSLMEVTGAPYAEVKESVGDAPGGVQDRSQATISKKATQTPPGLVSGLLEPQRGYLQGRGYDCEELVRLWGLGSVDETGGRLAWRVWIPVLDDDAELVSWTTRRITNKEPRYVSARDSESATPIEDCLYGIQYVRNGVVLVEGPADVWRVGPGAVALLGLRTSPIQLRSLADVPVRAIAFDDEPEAQLRARRLLRDLAVLPGLTESVVLESGPDPGSACESEITELRKRYLE